MSSLVLARCWYKRNKFVEQIGLAVVGVVKVFKWDRPKFLGGAISCTGKLSYFQSTGRQLTSLSTKSRPSEKTDFGRTTHRGRCRGTRVQREGSERSKSSSSCHFQRANNVTFHEPQITRPRLETPQNPRPLTSASRAGRWKTSLASLTANQHWLKLIS